MKIPECGELLDAGKPIANSAQHTYTLASPVGVMLARVTPNNRRDCVCRKNCDASD
jgi:hypothetical protein